MPVYDIETPSGRVLTIEAADEATAMRGAQEWHAQQGAAKPEGPSGALAGFQQGVSELAAGPARTLKHFISADTSGAEAAAAKVAPKDYKQAAIVDKDGVHASAIPQVLAENAPGMAVDIGAARIGAKIGGIPGALIGGIGSNLLRNLGSQAESRAASRTGDANAAPTTEDKVYGAGTAGVQALIDQTLLARFLPGAGKVASVGAAGIKDAAKELAKTAAVGVASGMAQDVVGQVGDTINTDNGVSVDPLRTLNAGAGGAVTSGALAAPKAVRQSSEAVRFRDAGGDNAEQSAALANRIQAHAKDQNLGDAKVGFEAVSKASSDVRNELADAVKELKASRSVDADTDNALARAQRGETLSKAEIARIEKAAGDPSSPVVALARQSSLAANLLGKAKGGKLEDGAAVGLKNAGIRFFTSPAGYLTGAGMSAAGLSGNAAAMFGYSPHAIGALLGIYGGAKTLDALTGKGRPAQAFADKFADPNVAIRPNAPAPVRQSQSPTGPKIAPAPTPWGAEAPADAKPSRANIVLEDGIAKIAKRLENDKRRSTVQEANPLLRKLAAMQKPEPVDETPPVPQPAPGTLSPEVLAAAKTAGWKMKLRGKSQDVADDAAAEARKAQGERAADAIAAQSPLVNDIGGLGVISNPSVGKRAGSLVAAANAIRKLQAQPSDEAEGPAPASAKIRKSKGKVTTEAAPVDIASDQIGKVTISQRALDKLKAKPKAEAQAEEPVYTPLNADQLKYRGMSDVNAAHAKLAAEKASGKDIFNEDGYMQSIVDARKERRNMMAEIAADANEADAGHMADLLEQLHHVRRRPDALNAIKHYTRLMSPEAAENVRKAFSIDHVNSAWKK